MDLGFLTSCLAEVTFPELSRWAAQAGFRALETGCVARGPTWYDGGRIVPSRIDDTAVAEIDELMASTGLKLSCLAYYDNMLDPDPAARDAHWKHLADVVRAAARLRVPVVACFVGRDPSQRVGECIAAWGRLAADVIALANNSGIRLAIENAPMTGWQFEDMPGNLAFSPELWEKIFTHARSDCVGLALDPSHLRWLGIDAIEAVTAYAERIYHVHAKDTEVFPDRLSDCSCLRPNGGWWRYRLPGLGEVDWRRFLSRLQENGYDAAISVELEDPVWTGSQEKVKRGLAFAQRYLEQFMV